MTSIFIDTFTYRWKDNGDSYYFGRTANNDIPQFGHNEKLYFLNEFITSLLIHDKILIKLDSIEELELLIGIENVLKLFTDDALQIIDDGGTLVGFLVNRKGNNMLMNFSNCSGLQIEAIEQRLDKKYKGKILHRKLQPLLLNVEKKKIDIDGAWTGSLIEEELYYDLNNKNLTKLLSLRAEDIVNIPDSDILSFMRLCYLNKSLIYQHDVNADFLLTEGFTSKLLANKLSPIFEKNTEPDKLFNKIISDKGIPDLASLILDEVIKFEHIIELRNSIDGKKFRNWFREKGWNKALIYEELMKFNPTIASKSWVRILRWIYPNFIGLATSGIAGVGAAAFDSLIVEKLLKGWHPNFFLDDKLKEHINSEINIHTKNMEESRIKKRLGRKVGRNEMCPCESGKKFKHCCGK
ncbi:SEC-C metal-binding domain-containing protein [Prolixibacter denitrificans]|nr:SEC-C metal-binding domain-containing protein [Prolixibacter denitrificans]PSK80565.1 SEC-C motif-containing protein [Prolixibacter denitrificans]